MSEVPGWYVDALERGLGQIVVMARGKDLSVRDLTDLFMDPATDLHTNLTPEQHMQTMAICMAIMVRRLAVVDVT